MLMIAAPCHLTITAIAMTITTTRNDHHHPSPWLQDARKGAVLDIALIRGVANMLVELGLQVYTEVFEEPFLQQTAAFYADESSSYIAVNTTPDYLRLAEQRLLAERDRGASFLHPQSMSRLQAILERTLIAGACSGHDSVVLVVHAHDCSQLHTSPPRPSLSLVSADTIDLISHPAASLPPRLAADHAITLLEKEGSGLLTMLERDSRDDLAR